MKELTQKQRKVLSFITEYINTHAYPPTIREIAEFFAISVKGAHDHVTALKKKGYIRQGDKKSRTMEIIRTEKDEGEDAFVTVPLLGTVAAGRPILSEENQEGSIRLPLSLMKKGKEYFAVKVRGDSMEGAGIMDGDTAIIEKKSLVPNGEIAVALINEAVTLKRFFKESNRIRLQAENPNYPPIYSRDVRILGQLSHIIRSY
ncbi:MAG: transcriptional repressor LexA [Treponema sp.]|jgi:repressor LexA|nr:transcriptional repressor LexA [Treponema sp.]